METAEDQNQNCLFNIGFDLSLIGSLWSYVWILYWVLTYVLSCIQQQGGHRRWQIMCRCPFPLSHHLAYPPAHCHQKKYFDNIFSQIECKFKNQKHFQWNSFSKKSPNIWPPHLSQKLFFKNLLYLVVYLYSRRKTAVRVNIFIQIIPLSVF